MTPQESASINTGNAPETVSTNGRAGIDRAFDVIRNHTVHTKGYVLTALKLIEEFGTAADKAMLNDLLQEKNQGMNVAISEPPKRKPTKRK